MKTCKVCNQTKPLDQMVKNSGCKDGYQKLCKLCKPIKLRSKNYKLQTRYGISEQDWNQLFEKQGGCCAICNRHQSSLKRKLYVDHDHLTGQVRGLLCVKCNYALGLLNDSPEIISKAETYLRRSRLKVV